MNNNEIEISDSIVLDNNKEYIVSGKTVYDGIVYLFLINDDEFTMHFAALAENQVVMLDNKEDKELIKKLMPFFLQSAAVKYQVLANEQTTAE